MQVDALALRIRPRSFMEAADLGARLCQASAGSVYACYLSVALPFAVLAVASFGMAAWLPGLVLWWAKPWFDRAVLFVLSRAAFGQRTTPAELWRARRFVLWHQFLHTWTLRRLSPWRSFTQPVYQLEGLSLGKARRRARQIRAGRGGQGLLVTSAFSLAELALTLAIASLGIWFAPPEQGSVLASLIFGDTGRFAMLVSSIAYALTVLFLEPFYVAAGFTMYLNRRSELEAWDIEQEFRRAFAQ